MEKSKRAVYVKCLAPIEDLIEVFGPIPQVFARCFVCNRQAKYVACCLDVELSKESEHGRADARRGAGAVSTWGLWNELRASGLRNAFRRSAMNDHWRILHSYKATFPPLSMKSSIADCSDVTLFPRVDRIAILARQVAFILRN
jgi:hypothetical protein